MEGKAKEVLEILLKKYNTMAEDIELEDGTVIPAEAIEAGENLTPEEKAEAEEKSVTPEELVAEEGTDQTA